jgi:hypothetical protein
MPTGEFAPTVTDSPPGSGSSGNPVMMAPSVKFSQAVVPGSVSFTLQGSGGFLQGPGQRRRAHQ